MQDLCLFAHYDKDDRVDDYVLWYLTHLKEANFNIVFISTGRLPRGELKRVDPYCFDVVLRENRGLDFGSWAEGLTKYRNAVTGRLLLANDSVYGPIGNLRAVLDRLTSEPADFYGMVETIQRAPHLQSWFLLFEPWVVRHPEFNAILAQPFSRMTKGEIIARGEIDLSRRLLAAGFHYRALYCGSRCGIAGRLHPVNPTHVLWRELLFEENIPFLKVEALRDNPVGIEEAEQILQEVERLNPQLCSVIVSHLARATHPTNQPAPLLFSSYRRRIYAVIQADYHFVREKRWAKSAWNSMKLLVLMLPVWPWRFLRSALRRQ